MPYTTTPTILATGDYGARNNTCIWCCIIAAICTGQKFDEKTFQHYLQIFQFTARKAGFDFPKIGEEVDVFENLELLNVIASQFHLDIQFLQCDNLLSIVFHDTSVRIGHEINKNKYFLCLYMRHFYLLKMDDLVSITEEQMNAIQTAELLEDFDQIQNLQSEIVDASRSK